MPELDDLVTLGGKLVNEAGTPARLLAKGLVSQAELLRDDQIPALRELVGLVELLRSNRKGIVQFAENLSGATSVNRRAGAYVQFKILNIELSPEGYGLPASAAKASGGQPSKLSRLLAEMLERTCRDANPVACLMRFDIPGLPAKLLSDAPAPRGGR